MSQDNLDFKNTVKKIMARTGSYGMEAVIVKEVLHYEIFKALYASGLLKNLVFQGGTSLRLCYGSNRFSEDLDFAGGREFSAQDYTAIEDSIRDHIGRRYGLNVFVKEPKSLREELSRQGVMVDKWQIGIETDPGHSDIPRQKIKLEIANIPAYSKEYIPLKLNYNELEASFSPIMLNVESLDEVLADKIIAFPASVRYIRYRDAWDIAWLIQKGASINEEYIRSKIGDYQLTLVDYVGHLENRIASIESIVYGKEFKQEMTRFIQQDVLDKTLEVEGFNDYLVKTLTDTLATVKNKLIPRNDGGGVTKFSM
ncbi:MAG: nucleotidyl transferase AbiEii/AbiGii toxin family protein [Methylophaga sp.]|nr:nucleotidyl transferase AbiEii/AbiGii toxin family protein [Methylophaga sp.]